MTVPTATVMLTGDGPESQASADELLKLASGDDFARWEAQLAATGNCANPVRLRGRVDAIDRVSGEKASVYDIASEPGGVLRIPCGNRREHVCPACSEVYKGDARQLIRTGLIGGKGIPESVARIRRRAAAQARRCGRQAGPRRTAQGQAAGGRGIWRESGTAPEARFLAITDEDHGYTV